MSLEQAQAWATLITATAAAIVSVIAVLQGRKNEAKIDNVAKATNGLVTQGKADAYAAGVKDATKDGGKTNGTSGPTA